MKPKISVIIPIYNVEFYLNDCLNSLLNQSFRNFEVILIDDGSSDNSGNICDEFAKLDKRFRVFHKVNEGVSVARNLGLQHAEGEWICFIDSDDWIDHNTLSIIEQIEDKEIDFIQFGFKQIDSSGHIIRQSEIPSSKLIMDKNDYFNNHFYHPAICGYIIKTDIVRKQKIRFPKGIKYGEDQAFILKSMMCCHKILIINRHFYNYRKREGSAMNSPISFFMAEDHLKVIQDIDIFMYEQNISLTYLHICLLKQLVSSYITYGIKSTNSIFKVKKAYTKFCDNIKNINTYHLCKSFDSYIIILKFYIKMSPIYPFVAKIKQLIN